MSQDILSALKSRHANGEYEGLIADLRQALAEEPRVFQDPFVKGWCARRWRFLFIREAVTDTVAVEAATEGGPWRRDSRPKWQRIARRFLHDEGATPLEEEMPPAQLDSSKTPTGTGVMFCPGLLTGILPVRAFADALPEVERRFRCKVLRCDAHPLRGCDANVEDLAKAFDHGIGRGADGRLLGEDEARPGGDFIVIAYSKGGPDLLTLLASRPDLTSRVKCIFFWASALGGSQIADNSLMRLQRLRLQSAEEKVQRLLRPFLPRLSLSEKTLERLVETDIADSLRSLATDERKAHLDEHRERFDALGIPFFHFAASTTLSEVPWFQARGYWTLKRHDSHNDMQLTRAATQLSLPMATELALLHGHHWDVAYPPFPRVLNGLSRNVRNPFPKTAAVVAMVQLAAELGLVQ